MTDLIDAANDYAERLTASSLARRAAKAAAARPTVQLVNAATGARVCFDCEEPIPAQRLAAYPRAVRCVECQERIERRARLRA